MQHFIAIGTCKNNTEPWRTIKKVHKVSVSDGRWWGYVNKPTHHPLTPTTIIHYSKSTRNNPTEIQLTQIPIPNIQPTKNNTHRLSLILEVNHNNKKRFFTYTQSFTLFFNTLFARKKQVIETSTTIDAEAFAQTNVRWLYLPIYSVDKFKAINPLTGSLKRLYIPSINNPINSIIGQISKYSSLHRLNKA